MLARAEVKLKTERLWLSPLGIEDFRVWRCSHETLPPALNQFDLDRNEVDLSATSFSQLIGGQIRQWEGDHSYHLGLFLPHKDAFLGHVSLMNVIRGNFQNAYLGFRLLSPHWGKGYAHEAVRTALQFGFNDLGLHRIEAAIEPDNARSVRLAKRLGMEEEGYSKARLFKRNAWLDMKIFALLAEQSMAGR